MYYEYSTYLTFPEVTDEAFHELTDIITESKLSIHLYKNGIEFDYVGKDHKRKVVKLFQKIAEIVKTAGGEIICEISGEEEGDPEFEFYSISGGKLYLQKGKIERENEIKEV